MIRLESLSPESPYLSHVVLLADQNTSRLGMFPASCFEREAAKGRIIIAIDEAAHLAGYVLFRTARNRAVVQHLCVAANCRGKGVAKQLMDDLKQRTSRLDGIALHCAREFTDACATWLRLGFTAIDEKPGRGKAARPLTRFWFDHRHPDLWTARRERDAAEKLVVVLDANVVFDLQDTERASASESGALLAEWLAEEVGLWVTDELYNEIDRHPDPAQRKRRKDFIRKFAKVNDPPSRTADLIGQLQSILPAKETDSNLSDRKQLASAIAAEADVFVTHDEEILSRAETIDSTFQIQVVEPAELVVRLDEVVRASIYAPVRIAGTPLVTRRVSHADLQQLSDMFLSHGTGEKKAAFNRVVHDLVTAHEGAEVSLVEMAGAGPLGLLAIDYRSHRRPDVRIIRVRHSRLSDTLIRQLLVRVIRHCATGKAELITVSDQAQPDALGGACQELGFTHLCGNWIKPVLSGLVTRADASDRVIALCNDEPVATEALAKILRDIDRSSIDPTAALQAETSIWPQKLRDAALSTFVIPIQPRFAAALFDESLAGEHLVGIDPELIFNCEHVYYRSAHVPVVRAPGRILWYVTKDRSRSVRAIRGCSLVQEVVARPAKELFRRFRRLGVYEWRDVNSIASKNNGKVLAIRFGVTEQFPFPISGAKARTFFVEAGRKQPTISMPIAIEKDLFERFYTLGTRGIDEGADARSLVSVNSSATLRPNLFGEQAI